MQFKITSPNNADPQEKNCLTPWFNGQNLTPLTAHQSVMDTVSHIPLFTKILPTESKTYSTIFNRHDNLIAVYGDAFTHIPYP